MILHSLDTSLCQCDKLGLDLGLAAQLGVLLAQLGGFALVGLAFTAQTLRAGFDLVSLVDEQSANRFLQGPLRFCQAFPDEVCCGLCALPVVSQSLVGVVDVAQLRLDSVCFPVQ